MDITKDMVTVLNMQLQNEGCSFKYEFIDTEELPKCKIVPSNSKYIHSYTISTTAEFQTVLREFFRQRSIEITFNNDGTIFWSSTSRLACYAWEGYNGE